MLLLDGLNCCIHLDFVVVDTLWETCLRFYLCYERVLHLPLVCTPYVRDFVSCNVVCSVEEACRSAEQNCNRSIRRFQRRVDSNGCKWTLGAAASWKMSATEDIAMLENLLGFLGSNSNKTVQEAISQMEEALNDTKLNLVKAQERTKIQVDKIKRDEEWKVGDWVFLSMRNLRNFAVHLLPKLRRRLVGPFTITKVVSPAAFPFDLHPGWQIHPTFHASNLKAYIRHPEFEWEIEPPPPMLMDGNLE